VSAETFGAAATRHGMPWLEPARAEHVLIDPDPRARHVPGIGRVVEPPVTGPPA
jgi:hypothetical protein